MATHTIDLAAAEWARGPSVSLLKTKHIEANGNGDEYVAAGVGFDELDELLLSAHLSRFAGGSSPQLTLIVEHRDTEEDAWEEACSWVITSRGRASVQRVQEPKARLRARWEVDGTNPRFVVTYLLATAEMGELLRGTNDPTASGNEIQQVDIVGSPDAGTYTLDLGGIEIGPIAFDAIEAAVQTAYDDALGAAQAIVTGNAASHTVEFDDAHGDQNQPRMTVAANALTDGGEPTADPTITTTQKGFALLGGRVAALYMRDNAGSGEAWVKISDTDGDWAQIATVP